MDFGRVLTVIAIGATMALGNGPRTTLPRPVEEPQEPQDLRVARIIGWKELGDDGLGKPPKWLQKASGAARIPVRVTPRDLGPIQYHYGITVYSSRNDGSAGPFVAWSPPFSLSQPRHRTWDMDPLVAVMTLIVDLDAAGLLVERQE